MPHDPLSAFHDAVRYGPAACPDDLFAGTVPHIIRGLKVYANNVAHARRTALEDTYPRLLSSIGADRFHAVATRFLDQGEVLSRSLDALGEGFAEFLDDARERDLARAEWAWLQSFHAAEARALLLTDVGAMTPDALVESRFGLHPAVRMVELDRPEGFRWDEPLAGAGAFLLLTRPDADVLLRRIEASSATIVASLGQSRTCADLLGGDPTPLLPLFEAGALIMETSR